MSPGPDYQPPGRDTGRRGRAKRGANRFLSRFDRFVLMLERVGRSLWIGVVVVGVALGAIAVFIIVNKPDDDEATELLASLELGPVPVRRYAPDDWTHVCLGEPGLDGRDLLRDIAGLDVTACSGWNQSFVFYDSYAAIAFGGPSGCHVIAVNAELFVPAAPDASSCTKRSGLMALEIEGQGLGRQLTVSRR